MIKNIIYCIGLAYCASQIGEAAEKPEFEKIDFKKLRVDLDRQLWWGSKPISNSKSKSELVRDFGIVEVQYINMEKRCVENDKAIKEFRRQSEKMLKAMDCVEFATNQDPRWLGEKAGPDYKKRIGECLDIYRKGEQWTTNSNGF